MNPNKIFSEYSKFRKHLNAVMRARDMIDINYEYDLDKDFHKTDTADLIDGLNKMRSALVGTRKALQQ